MAGKQLFKTFVYSVERSTHRAPLSQKNRFNVTPRQTASHSDCLKGEMFTAADAKNDNAPLRCWDLKAVLCHS